MAATVRNHLKRGSCHPRRSIQQKACRRNLTVCGSLWTTFFCLLFLFIGFVYIYYTQICGFVNRKLCFDEFRCRNLFRAQLVHALIERVSIVDFILVSIKIAELGVDETHFIIAAIG